VPASALWDGKARLRPRAEEVAGSVGGSFYWKYEAGLGPIRRFMKSSCSGGSRHDVTSFS
jgi:hypothetical protein